MIVIDHMTGATARGTEGSWMLVLAKIGEVATEAILLEVVVLDGAVRHVLSNIKFVRLKWF